MKKVEKSDEEWKKTLTKQQYRVLRKAGTEMPFTGKYVNTNDSGMYVCAACGNKLFSSGTKFHSGSGWPSFWDAVDPEAIEKVEDNTLGMRRTEVRCAKCGGHLGHVFDDGPKDKTGKRYCINSCALKLEK